MATDEGTIESLEKIKEAIKVIQKEFKTLDYHIRQQKRQPSGQ